MVYFINDIITGALIGLLYALVAMGFVVIYRASKVFNFAQGELVIIGGFIVWFTTMQLGLSLWLSIPLSLVMAGLVGYAIERIFLTKLIGESVFSMVMVTVGLLILLRGLVLLLFGPAVRPFPIIFPLKPLFLGDMLIPMNLLIGGIITIVAAVGLSWFFWPAHDGCGGRSRRRLLDGYFREGLDRLRLGSWRDPVDHRRDDFSQRQVADFSGL